MGRKAEHGYTLKDGSGRRIGYTMYQRTADPFVFVRFKAPDGRYLERSTGKGKAKDGEKVAEEIIEREYAAPIPTVASWDEVRESLLEEFRGQNIAPKTQRNYFAAFDMIRASYGATNGPEDVSVSMAKSWATTYANTLSFKSKKPGAVGRRRSAQTVVTRLSDLSSLWAKWLVEVLDVASINPSARVEGPKLEKKAAVVPDDADVQHFFKWLDGWLDGWELPKLFFVLKEATAARLMDLCMVETAHLDVKPGCIFFPARNTKGRKDRTVPLDPALYQRLKDAAGITYLWQNHPKQLKPILKAKARTFHRLQDRFSPERLYRWVEGLFEDYHAAHPDKGDVKSHGFRKRRFTEAWEANINPHKAAIALGCNVQTMMKHYVALDEQATTDEVFAVLHQRKAERASATLPDKSPDYFKESPTIPAEAVS